MTNIVSKLRTALSQLNETVGSTMGPNGHNVSILAQKGMPLRITKDGATAAEHSNHENADIHGFIRNITEVAKSVETEVGDGTTTATIMSTRLIDDLLTLVDQGFHPRRIIRDMDKLLNQMIRISGDIKEVTTDDDVLNVAMVSTNHDAKMAETVKRIVTAIGPFGRFRTTTGRGDTDIVNTAQGYTIDTGICNELLLKSSGKPRTAKGRVIIHPKELTALDLNRLLKDATLDDGQSLFILCDHLAEEDSFEIIEALNNVNTSMSGIYPILLNSTPFIRQQQRDDIAGIIDEVAEITMERTRTTFHIDGASERVQNYINSVEESSVGIGSGFDLEIHKERIQRLRGGYANIMACGATTAESKERRDRINDALLATQSAIREGYVLGGGNHYLMIAALLNDVPEYLETAVNAFLEEVYRRVHINSGVDTELLDNMIDRFDTSGETVIELIDFSDNCKTIKVEDFTAIDSAGTPVRVFEATRSLMHTLLPIKHHVGFNNNKFEI